MRPTENIIRLIKNAKIKTDPMVNDAVLNDLLNELDKSESTRSPVSRPNLWRKIMKSKMTKFAAAAAIVAVAVLTFLLLDKSSTAAYALEQTIQASHNVQYLHIKSIMASIPGEPGESWIEFDPTGQVRNMRLHKPAWMDPNDGYTVIVWKDNKMQLWIKKKNILATIKDKEIAAGFFRMVEQINPKNAVENILQAQGRGDTKVEINEPENKTNPIVITADMLKKSDLPFQRVILSVDQATKLVKSVQTYQKKDGKYILFMTLEFYDYDMPIDPKMFMLENEIPADALRVDQTTQEVGLAQGDLNDKEIAAEVVRQFLDALINQDYAKAGRLFGGTPAERMQKTYGKIRFLRIISIGAPVPHALTGGLYVPCTVEIEENGKITQWHPEHSYVRKVHGQPGRWEIIGGFRGI